MCKWLLLACCASAKMSILKVRAAKVKGMAAKCSFATVLKAVKANGVSKAAKGQSGDKATQSSV
jgi:hypothetical protein